MGALPTVIPSISAAQFLRRLSEDLPNGWAGQDALQGGAWSSLLEALGGGLSSVMSAIQYTASATRIPTSTSPELDEASLDFFGGSLPRPPGMPDASFAQLIINSLFNGGATRPAIAAAIQRLTGAAPRMLEAHNIFDTGVWRLNSYWNVDTPANPGRWGGYQQNQGFIETIAPADPAIGSNNPILCWGTTAFWNVPGYFFGIISAAGPAELNNLISTIKAEGITVWVKILQAPPQGNAIAVSTPRLVVATTLSFSSITASWLPPVQGTGPVQYLVQYRVNGTTAWQQGPITDQLSVVISGLQPFTFYDVRIGAKNTINTVFSGVSTAQTQKQPPSAATNLSASLVQATAITLTWQPPLNGTGPFSYLVQYRVVGTQTFSTLVVGVGTVGVTLIGLNPDTPYEIEVVTSTT